MSKAPMSRIKLPLLLVALLTMATGCGSGTRSESSSGATTSTRAESTQPRPSASVTTTTAAASNFTVIPFFYTTEGPTNGFLTGLVDIAVVNTTGKPSVAQRVTGVQARVETQEGQTYPAGLFSFLGSARSYKSYDDTFRQRTFGLPAQASTTFSFSGNLPPGLPISMALDANPTDEGLQQVIKFQFAQAAHPTRVVLSAPGLSASIDLTTAAAKSPKPTGPPGVTVKALGDLTAQLSALNSKIRLVPSGCIQEQSYPSDYMLQFTAVNSDQFNESRLAVDYAVWYQSGVLVQTYARSGDPFAIVGPAQTLNGKVKFHDLGAPKYLVVYSGGNTTLYDLGCK